MNDVRELVAVRFTRKRSPYNAGETAGFAPAVARNLVKSGDAVLVEGAKPKAPKRKSGAEGLESDPLEELALEKGTAKIAEDEKKAEEAKARAPKRKRSSKSSPA